MAPFGVVKCHSREDNSSVPQVASSSFGGFETPQRSTVPRRIAPAFRHSLFLSLKRWSLSLSVAAALGFPVTLPAQTAGDSASASLARQLHEAVSVAEQGDTKRALAMATDLARQHPGFGPAFKLEGMIYEDSGDPANAYLAYATALKLSPTDNELRLKVGVFDLQRGKSDAAVAVLQQLVKSLPRDEEGLYYLAQAYHLAGDDKAALKTIRLATTAHPANVQNWQKYGELLCSSGDNEAALLWLKKAQIADPKLARINLDLAVASYNNMEFTAATNYASSEVELRPDAIEALALLAAARIKLDQWKEAEEVLDRITQLGKQDASTLLELGQSQLELKQYQASIDTLQKALQLDPTLQLAHFYLSRDFNGLGQTDAARHEAALHRDMMQQIAFTLPKAEVQRETLLSEQARQLLSEQKEVEAVELFRHNLTGPVLTPGGPYVSVGSVYLEMGEPVDAERMLKHAIEVDPRARGAHTYLGILALQRGDFGKAEREFDAELAIDANHPLALAELGELRYRQGKWSEAVNYLVRSKTAIPQFLYMLCDSYFHLGNVAAANITAESLAAYAHNKPEMIASLRDLLLRKGQSDLAQRIAPTNQP